MTAATTTLLAIFCTIFGLHAGFFIGRWGLRRAYLRYLSSFMVITHRKRDDGREYFRITALTADHTPVHDTGWLPMAEHLTGEDWKNPGPNTEN